MTVDDWTTETAIGLERIKTVSAQVQTAAPLLRALVACSPGLQSHAIALISAILDPAADTDDRFAAAATLADVLYPERSEPTT